MTSPLIPAPAGAWRLHASIWRNAVFRERRTMVLGWTAVCLLGAIAGAVLGAKTSEVAAKGLLAGFTFPLMCLAALYWMLFIPGAVMQNSPANAKLAPRLHAAVVRTAIATWIVCLVPVALFAFGAGLEPIHFLYIVFMMTTLGMVRGGVRSAMGVHVVAVIGSAGVLRPAPLLHFLATPAGIAAVALLCLGMAVLGLHLVFPKGGERHFQLLAPQRRQQAGTALAELQRISRKDGRGTGLYARWLRRDLRLGRRAELLLHALGPQNHRLDFVFPLAGALALAAFVKAVLWMLGIVPEEAVVQVSTFMVALAPLLQGLFFERLATSASTTAGEQALVRMTPGAPCAAQLGQVLGRAMLGICLREWLAWTVLAAAVVLLFGGGATQLMLLASVSAASLAMTGWALRDYAGRRPASRLATFLLVQLMGFGIVALFAVHNKLPLWGALMLVMVAAACAIVRSRWKRMLAAPAPFPSGRLA